MFPAQWNDMTTTNTSHRPAPRQLSGSVLVMRLQMRFCVWREPTTADLRVWIDMIPWVRGGNTGGPLWGTNRGEQDGSKNTPPGRNWRKCFSQLERVKVLKTLTFRQQSSHLISLLSVGIYTGYLCYFCPAKATGLFWPFVVAVSMKQVDWEGKKEASPWLMNRFHSNGVFIVQCSSPLRWWTSL